MPDHRDRIEIPFDERATGEIRMLDPEAVRLFRTPEGVPRAELRDEFVCLHVQLMCAFPLSTPHDFVSLRDGKNRELGVIESLADLDGESRSIAEKEIDRRYFLPEITAVHRLDSHFGTYDWDVDTDRGPRSFLVRGRSENIVILPPARVVVTDVLGNRYQVSDARKLTGRSAILLQKIL